jgi:hypothetical protein
LEAIPDNIKDVDDSITKQIIQCPVSKRLFRIVESELTFYRKHNIPLPIHHPDVRFATRAAHRPQRNMYVRTCDKT